MTYLPPNNENAHLNGLRQQESDGERAEWKEMGIKRKSERERDELFDVYGYGDGPLFLKSIT